MPYILLKGKGKDKNHYAIFDTITEKIYDKYNNKKDAMAQLKLLSSLYYFV